MVTGRIPPSPRPGSWRRRWTWPGRTSRWMPAAAATSSWSTTPMTSRTQCSPATQSWCGTPPPKQRSHNIFISGSSFVLSECSTITLKMVFSHNKNCLLYCFRVRQPLSRRPTSASCGATASWSRWRSARTDCGPATPASASGAISKGALWKVRSLAAWITYIIYL